MFKQITPWLIRPNCLILKWIKLIKILFSNFESLFFVCKAYQKLFSSHSLIWILVIPNSTDSLRRKWHIKIIFQAIIYFCALIFFSFFSLNRERGFWARVKTGLRRELRMFSIEPVSVDWLFTYCKHCRLVYLQLICSFSKKNLF